MILPRFVKFFGLTGLFVFSIGFVRLGASEIIKPAIGWNNPGHAYILLEDQTSTWYVSELALDGNPSETHELGGSSTGICHPIGVAINPDGRIYVMGFVGIPKCRPGIEIFARGASGNVRPIAEIRGPKAGIHEPSGIAFDRQGRLYVADGHSSLQGSIKVYAAGATGDVAPIAVISGPHTQLENGYQPTFVAIDENSDIFVAQAATSGVGEELLKFPAGSNGDVSPTATTNVNGDGGGELQASGSTVYVAFGVKRHYATPVIYELSARDLSQTRTIMYHPFEQIFAAADAQGRLYVEDLSPHFEARLFEFPPGHQKPSRLVKQGFVKSGGYVVVGP